MSMEPGRAQESARGRASSEIEGALVDLIRVSKTWTKSLAARFGSDLSPLSFAMLRYVLGHSPVRSSDVASSFGLDKATVSRAIKVLRDKGLLETAPDPHDGRASVLVPTELARRDFDRYREETRQQYRTVLDDWSNDELEQLAGLLRRLATELTPDSGGGAPSSEQ
jgi:DNA-binding MarR family transcriptional regulator